MASGKHFNRSDEQQIQGCVPQLCITPCFFPLHTLISGMQIAFQLVLTLPLLSHTHIMSHTPVMKIWQRNRKPTAVVSFCFWMQIVNLPCNLSLQVRSSVKVSGKKMSTIVCDFFNFVWVGHHIGAAGFNGIYALSSILQTFPPAASRSNYILIIFW